MRKLISVSVVVLIICVLFCGPAWTQDKPAEPKKAEPKKVEDKKVEDKVKTEPVLWFSQVPKFKDGQIFEVHILHGICVIRKNVKIALFRIAPKKAPVGVDFVLVLEGNILRNVPKELAARSSEGEKIMLFLMDVKTKDITFVAYNSTAVVKEKVAQSQPAKPDATKPDATKSDVKKLAAEKAAAKAKADKAKATKAKADKDAAAKAKAEKEARKLVVDLFTEINDFLDKETEDQYSNDLKSLVERLSVIKNFDPGLKEDKVQKLYNAAEKMMELAETLPAQTIIAKVMSELRDLGAKDQD